MSVTVLSESWQVARKSHGCNACLGTIAAGESLPRKERDPSYEEVP